MVLLPGNWMNKDIRPEDMSLKAIAHLGDAVYELYIRRKTIFYTQKLDKLHTITTSYVNSLFQVELLEHLRPVLTEAELDILRRARNQSLTSAKRKEQATHRNSTSFEALIGYLYLTDQNRLEELLTVIDSFIENKK